MLGIADPWAAYCVDLTLAYRLGASRGEETPDGLKRNGGRGGYGKPPDERTLALLPTVES